jgi:hypothetical protein
MRADELHGVKSDEKSGQSILVRRWIESEPRIHAHSIRIEPYRDRTLDRLFTDTVFYRLVALRAPQDTVSYGCISLGQPLLLPQEFNLLLILENRPLNAHNAETLAEIIVRLADPEGSATLTVMSREVQQRDDGEIKRAVIETWSQIREQRKRWTLDVRNGMFHSVEEKLVEFRPMIHEDTDRRNYEGPTSGDERYIVLWRDPRDRSRMQEIRRIWHELRRPATD